MLIFLKSYVEQQQNFWQFWSYFLIQLYDDSRLILSVWGQIMIKTWFWHTCCNLQKQLCSQNSNFLAIFLMISTINCLHLVKLPLTMIFPYQRHLQTNALLSYVTKRQPVAYLTNSSIRPWIRATTNVLTIIFQSKVLYSIANIWTLSIL